MGAHKFYAIIRASKGNKLKQQIKGIPPRPFDKRLHPTPALSLEQLAQIVSEVSGVSVEDIRSSVRLREFVKARHSFCYLAFHFTTVNLKKVGDYLGHGDHSNILYAKRAVNDSLHINDGYFSSIIDPCKEILLMSSW